MGAEDYSVAAIEWRRRSTTATASLPPTKGYIFDASLDFAPNDIGAIPFVRGRVRFSYYVPVTTKSTLALEPGQE